MWRRPSPCRSRAITWWWICRDWLTFTERPIRSRCRHFGHCPQTGHPADMTKPTRLDPSETSARASLFHNQMLRGRYRRRRGRGDSERQPGIPSGRTVGCTEFAVSPQAKGALHVSDREAVSALRTGAETALREATEDRVLAGIVGDLLVGVSGNADEKLLGEVVRCAPVEVEIDAAPVLGGGVPVCV